MLDVTQVIDSGLRWCDYGISVPDGVSVVVVGAVCLSMAELIAAPRV